jgi:alkyl sulfatase BDS1-like metallo-beta-lactamase superfamily hydrolase
MSVLKIPAVVLAAVCLLSAAMVHGDDSSEDSEKIVFPTTATQLFADVYNNNTVAVKLLERQAQFISTPYIRKIADGMYLTVNYAMGNSLWVVTPENTIIVFDTPESNEISLVVRNDMRQQPEIGTKPITFIFYSVFHGDHTFGAQPLVTDPYNNGVPPVIVAQKYLTELAEFFDTFSFIKMNRVLRIFGSLLPANVFITPFAPLKLGAVTNTQYYPTALLDLKKAGDTQDLILNGLSIKAIYIPGYTDDQTAFFFPATKVLHAADIYYGVLPNIYTLRGEPARDAVAWSNTVRIVQSYNAEVVSPSHGHALFGKDYIYNLFGKYADVLQYIHDQTVRLLGKGYTPDVVSRLIKLPLTFTSEPELEEFYGLVEGHSKAVADRYTGWYNGQTEDLLPVSKPDLARNMVRDFGRGKLIEKARKAYQSGDYRWSLTLASHVWLYENKSQSDALYWRTQSMKRLAEGITANQYRNYLFTEAMVNWKVLPTPYLNAVKIRSRPTFLKLHTLSNCFTLLRVHLNAQLADGIDKTVDISVTDDQTLKSGQVYRLRIYNSVLTINVVDAVDPLNPKYYPSFQTTNVAFRQVLAGLVTIDQALTTLNTISVVRGTSDDLRVFFGYFDFVDEL